MPIPKQHLMKGYQFYSWEILVNTEAASEDGEQILFWNNKLVYCSTLQVLAKVTMDPTKVY